MFANKIKIFRIIAMSLTLLAIVPKIESKVRPTTPTNHRRFCASQFAVVNYACGRLPFTSGHHLPP